MTRFKLIAIISLVFFASACQTRVTDSNWPQNIPAKDYFVDSGSRIIGTDSPNFERKLSNYLTWIKRFYLGSFIYPLGWNEMTENVLDSLEPTAQQQDVERRMNRLGKLISAEWAQDGNSRRINSANVAAWGNALRKAVETGEQIQFIDKVEQDVDGLLNGRLNSDDINLERYYAPPVYDDF